MIVTSLIFVSKAGMYPGGDPRGFLSNGLAHTEVSLSDKHSSLLRYIINYNHKKFYDTGP